MNKTIFLALLIAATAESFVLLKPSQKRVSAAQRNANEDTISKMYDEYNELLADLETKRGKAAAVDLTEEMLEKAVQLAKQQKVEQEEKLAAAEEEFRHAVGDLEKAELLHRQAQAEGASAENQVEMLETVDSDYEDMERLRDLSVAHSAHQLEQDAVDLEVDAVFHELEAEGKHEKAKDLLQQLEEKEEDLKATLKELKALKNEKAMESWETRAAESFHHSVKDKLHLRSQEG